MSGLKVPLRRFLAPFNCKATQALLHFSCTNVMSKDKSDIEKCHTPFDYGNFPIHQIFDQQVTQALPPFWPVGKRETSCVSETPAGTTAQILGVTFSGRSDTVSKNPQILRMFRHTLQKVQNYENLHIVFQKIKCTLSSFTDIT